MGFSQRKLCQAERQGKEIADKLDAAEAGERVRVISETMVGCPHIFVFFLLLNIFSRYLLIHSLRMMFHMHSL
jgi:hypothetical protein